MHVSLKDVFGIIAFCAVVAWSASLAGIDNPGFWIGAGGSILLSLTFARQSMHERRWRYAFLVPLPFFACCLVPFASVSLFVNSVLLAVVGLIFASRPTQPVRRIWFVSLSTAAVSLVLAALPSMREIRKLEALRREFPIVSLTGRLQYERASRETPGGSSDSISSEVTRQLAVFEDSYHLGGMREHQFRQIHSRRYEAFIRASGFGVGRMIRPSLDRLRRPPLQDIPILAESHSEWSPDSGDWRGAAYAGKSGEVEHLHAVSRSDFLDPLGFGAVIEPRKKVVGFIEHAFHHSPLVGMEPREVWTIVRLELMSLLRFDEPRVYVLDHLPRMDQLASEDVPTRPLDSFEAAALEQLWTQKDFVLSQDGSHHRMLGALRAAQQCLDCHTAERGELLGAFSYVLQQREPASLHRNERAALDTRFPLANGN